MNSFIYGVLATASLVSGVYGQNFGAVPAARALQKRGLSGLRPRQEDLNLYFSSDDHYSFSKDSVVAKVSMSPKYPTLLLDDVDSLIKDVACTSEGIVLKFHQHEHFLYARSTLDTQSPLTIVTTKPGCAVEGEHQAYLVHSVQFSEGDLGAVMDSTVSSLKECSKELRTELGSHFADEIDKARIFKRTPVPQASTPAGSAAPLESGNIGFAFADTALIPPSPLIAPLLEGFGVPEGVEVACKNCSSTGIVTLTAGGFTQHTADLETLTDFVVNGFLDFTVTGMTAIVELALNILPGAATLEFAPQLPPIPILGISIPGVSVFGLVFEPTFPITLSILETMSVTTGFSLQVPDGSSFRIGIGDDSKSYTQGFLETALTPVPVQVDRSDLAFGVTAAFQPQLNLKAMAGSSNGPFDINGELGVFMDLPLLNLSMVPRSNVNAACVPAGPTDQSFPAALEVLAAVVINAGYRWEIDFADIQLPSFDIDRETPLISQAFPLAAQCLTFDAGSIIPPPAAPAPAPTLSSTYAVVAAPTAAPADAYATGSKTESEYKPCDPKFNDDGTIEYCDDWAPH